MPADLPGLAKLMAEALVEHPEAVSVDAFGDDHNVELELRVADDDLGRVIGRNGRTARCLRNVLTAAAEKHGQRCSLDILEEDEEGEEVE
jgi:predicted RNA-binding protein YlqC (UPF0109 family)